METGTGVCAICGPVELWGLKGLVYCPNRKREARWVHTYGITMEQFFELARRQRNRCAICRVKLILTGSRTYRKAAVDHDHETGQIRGILCGSCNVGLGNFKDDTNILLAAVAYLRRRVE
jgi:hypothetical protein